MLAIQSRSSSNGNEYQRRPTRISSSFEAASQSATTIQNQQQDVQIKLKCSTATRVSTTTAAAAASRSRLRPPVASSLTSNSSIANESSSSTATNSKTSRVRPSSIALKSCELSLSSNKLNQRTVGLNLPRINGNTNLKSSRIESNYKKSSDKITTSTNENNNQFQSSKISNCLSSSRQQTQVRRQNASTNKVNSVTSSGQSSESRLGGTKNGLVAVVHPQHSQRVNSNLTSKVNKLTIMNKSTITTTAIAATKSKIESGKVGSSYQKREVHEGTGKNGCVSATATKLERQTKSRSRESKQDGGQIVARHSNNIKTATTGTTLNEAAYNNATTTSSVSQMTSPPHYSTSCCPSSSSCSTSTSTTITTATSEADDESDQFSPSNTNNDNDDPTKYLLSVASNNGDLYKDKKHQQHGNNKQSNKHLSAHTYSSSTNTTTTTTTTTQMPVKSLMEQKSLGSNNAACLANANDDKSACCRNNKHDGAKSTNPTKSQAPTLNSASGRNTTTISYAINNDHLLPKPMGQQVLSLMMLDVGLLPANSNNSNGHHHNQKQMLSPKRRSHVRLQSPTRQDVIDYTSNSRSVNSHLLDNGQSFINHDRNPSNRLNNSNDCADHELLSNDFHSWQLPPLQPITTATAHEMLRLQVRLSNQDNEKLKSISLPSSPRIRFLDSNSNQNYNDKLTRASGLESLRQSNPIHMTPPRSNHDNFRTKATNLLSNTGFSLDCQPPSSFSEHLVSFCDNQDSNSLTSSSCSSLNQCPPLLALSNQLNVLKFEELVNKGKSDLNTEKNNKQQNSYLCESSIRLPISLQNSANSTTATRLSSAQVAKVSTQHEQSVTDDSNLETEKHCSKKKINHAEECSQQFEGLKFSNLNSNSGCSREQTIKNTNHNNNHHHPEPYTTSQVQPNELALGDESCLDPQSRRQQQPRSHSISGQEFHSNGGYQRLKHSLYNSQQQQQGVAFDGYQNYAAQATSGRLQQIPSPYQQHQLVGRSPSPLSINCQTGNYGSPSREGSIKQYPLDPHAGFRLPRNQLHASLECLNTTHYSDYNQIQRLQEQQQQLINQHQQQQQQQQILNQHYAASYVLAAPPVNTIINSNGDQDLAAAAMGTPPSQCNSNNNNNNSNSITSHLNMSAYGHQTQNLINRAMAQVSQSPLRRLGLNNPQGASSGLLSHMSNHHPMRAGHSSLSLASSSFLLEDKLQNEIRKLQSELKSEKEKNEALNSQLNINSSLMAAFEQSLTTLNTRLRQLTTLNEKKDNEIEELREQLRSSNNFSNSDKGTSPSSKDEVHHTDIDNDDWIVTSEINNNSERSMMMKTIEDLKRQLIEKDRILTDTRLEALSAAHQLEQLESKLNGEHSILVNEDELDEGVMEVNHSPSDSDAVTDSAHFSEINSQISKSNQQCNGDNISFNNTSNTHSSSSSSNNNNNITNNTSNFICSSNDHNNTDDHNSNHSSDYQSDQHKERDQQQNLSSSISQQFNETDSGVMCKLMDNLLLTN